MIREDAKKEFSYASNTEARMGNPHDKNCTGTLNEFKNKGLGHCKVIASKPYSNHPDDYYLRMVLSELPHQYSVHFENLQDSVRCGEPVFHEGHYYPKTIEGLGGALRKFNERGRIHFVEPDPKILYEYEDTELMNEVLRRMKQGYRQNEALVAMMKSALREIGELE